MMRSTFARLLPSLCLLLLFNACLTSKRGTTQKPPARSEDIHQPTHEAVPQDEGKVKVPAANPPVSDTPEVTEFPEAVVKEAIEDSLVQKPVETAGVPVPDKREGPHVPREFRAAWVASVANINWPSKPGLSSQEQQQEAIKLLDLLKENNF